MPREKDTLTAVLREGARRLLDQAIKAEVEELLSGYQDEDTEIGHRRVVRGWIGCPAHAGIDLRCDCVAVHPVPSKQVSAIETLLTRVPAQSRAKPRNLEHQHSSPGAKPQRSCNPRPAL